MNRQYYAPRTCYEIVGDKHERKTYDLETLRSCPAYVLLGRPGVGKTTSFEQEASRPNCQYLTARDFITFDIRPEWQNKTLFIDGLDEVSAGKGDVISSLDKIRAKLDQLGRLNFFGRPNFRLSCREADWYGNSDSIALQIVPTDRKIKELFLIELAEDALQKILIKNHHKTEDQASSFLQEAQRNGLAELIKNPQMLEILVKAVSEGSAWPERKLDVFEMACKKLLLEEFSGIHRIIAARPSPEELMQLAGKLCAVTLLARKPGFVSGFVSPPGFLDENYPDINDMATGDKQRLHLVAKTRLFTTRGERTEYSHRMYAEYLAAHYLSKKIGGDDKLPVERVLALMTGNDGGVIAELRGVYAWLAALCQSKRTMLVKRDPLGVVLYGDASLFSKDQRMEILYQLSEQAEKAADSGISYKTRRLLGVFCQDDMEQDFRRILDSSDRSGRRQYLI